MLKIPSGIFFTPEELANKNTKKLKRPYIRRLPFEKAKTYLDYVDEHYKNSPEDKFDCYYAYRRANNYYIKKYEESYNTSTQEETMGLSQ